MDEVTGSLQLKPGREKPVGNRHPWLFSGAIKHVAGEPQTADLVDIVSHSGEWLARGYYNPHSQIRARVLSWKKGERLGKKWWRNRLAEAAKRREFLQLAPSTTAYRLVNAEADLLPGLVLDKYGDFLVMQCLTAGIDRRKSMLAELAAELMGTEGVLERSDISVRRKEGLHEAVGPLWGEAPGADVVIRENGLDFAVDLYEGHKTGLYLDQRENRAFLGQPRFVAGKSVLNAFAYTGGFGVYAAVSGAISVTHVDSSASALALARRNYELNGLVPARDEFVEGDAFEVLRGYAEARRSFDVIVLDPPKFAFSQRDVRAATRGYKDINWLALRLLRPGGILATFSCSGLIDRALFQKVVFGAAIDAGRNAQILFQMDQGPDHPILLTAPESAYLKGLLLTVV